MKNYPYLWFTNIVRLLEKRPFSILNVLLFSLFVGAFRLFAEWALGGFYPKQMFVSLLTVSGFYWHSFFVITAALSVLVDQPWRVSINVILVGIFLGIFPPLIDTLVSGTGFNYSYLWNVFAEWRWEIYNPEHHIPAGEAIVLWAVIALTALYVHLKTQSAGRTAAGFAVAYLVVIVIAGLPASFSEWARSQTGWPFDHRAVLLVLTQYALVVVLYLTFQRTLWSELPRVVMRIAPLLLLCLMGAALAGGITETAWIYTSLLGLTLVCSHLSSAGPGDEEDRLFFIISFVLVLAALVSAHATVAVPFVMLFAVLRYAPHQHWSSAAAAFVCSLIGIVAAVEHAAFEAPRWWISLVPRPLHPEAVHSFDAPTRTALLLLLAALAWAAFLAGRRAQDPTRTLPPWATGATAAGVTLIPFALAAMGKIGWAFPAGGLVAGVGAWMLLSAPPSRGLTIWGLQAGPALYILYLVVALQTNLTGF